MPFLQLHYLLLTPMPMYRILIIEDEAPARKKLKRFIEKIDASCEVLAEIETVEEVKEFLIKGDNVDLIFSDIELRDGNVFDAYKDVSINCPIIFATAYNEFLMNAFEANGIEYLLKPFSFERFTNAWDKFVRLQGNQPDQLTDLMLKMTNLISEKTTQQTNYKDQFAIKTNKGVYFLKVEDIVCFEADSGVIFGWDKMNKKHMMTQTVFKDLEIHLDPQEFFKINRSDIVHRKFITKLKRYNKNTVSVYLNVEGKRLRTSQNRTGDFNSWLGV
jgi:DNA-binding LytR/AlgR family response regulator